MDIDSAALLLQYGRKTIMHDVNNKYVNIQEEIISLNEKIQRIKAKDQEQTVIDDDIINDLLSRVLQLEDIVDALSVELTQSNIRIKRTEAAIVDIKQTLYDMQIQIDQIDDFKKRVEELDSKVAELVDALQQLNDLVEDVRRGVSDKRVIHKTHAKINDQLNDRLASERSLRDMLVTEYGTDKMESVLKMWDSYRSVSRCFSWSYMTQEMPFSMSYRNGDVVLFEMHVTSANDDAFNIVLVDDTNRYERTLPYYDEENLIVIYTMSILWAKVYPYDVNVGSMEYNMRSITLSSDVDLRRRAYSGLDYTYSNDDVIFSMRYEDMSFSHVEVYDSKATHSMTGFVGSRLVSQGETLDTQLMHTASAFDNEMSWNIFSDSIAAQYRELQREVNDDSILSASGVAQTVANLALQVNNLNAVVVRSVTANVLTMSGSPLIENLTCIPSALFQHTVLEDDYGGVPRGAYDRWWKENDILWAQGYTTRKLMFEYEIQDNHVSKSHRAIVMLAIKDNVTEHTVPCEMLVDMVLDPIYGYAKGLLRHDDGSSWDKLYIHLPQGRSEIGSDNDNSTIFNGLSMQPRKHFTSSAHTWACIKLLSGSNLLINVRLYPSDAFPLTSSVVPNEQFMIKIPTVSGYIEKPIALTWKSFVEKQNGLERLVFSGTGTISDVLTIAPIIMPLGMQFVWHEAPAKSSTVKRLWRSTGIMQDDLYNEDTKDYAWRFKVDVPSAVGGKSIATTLYYNAKMSIVNIPVSRQATFDDQPTTLVFTHNGLQNAYGTVQLVTPANMLTIQYIRDPLGIGSVDYVDHDIADLIMRLNGMQSQLIALQDLVDHLEKRLKMVEDALASMTGGMASALTMLSTVASYINPMAGIVVIALSATYTMVEIAEYGITPERITYLITNLLDAAHAISFRTGKTGDWVQAGHEKYDMPSIATKAQEQVIKVNIDKFKRGPGHVEENAPKALSEHSVQVMAKPLDELNFKPKYFDDVLRKMQEGTATKTEIAVFNAFTKMKINPTHQYLRMSNCRHEDGVLVKDVWIFGIGDGYADMVSRNWLGTRTSGILPRKEPGWVGPGVFKMAFAKDSAGEWTLRPARMSGMTDEEILVAGGATHDEAKKWIAEWDDATRNSAVTESFDKLVDYYLLKTEATVVKNSNLHLMDGQLDALMNVLKTSKNGSYSYSLIGNNCQHFVDDVLKFLTNPMNKPQWMQDNDYLLYLRTLDDGYANYSS